MRLPCLTYFSSRGRAEQIRLLLADAAVEHDEIAVGVWSPTELPPAFVELRATGKLAYGALPLWEEPDGFRLAQSDAILRHLARTHDRYGANPREAARCDELISGVDDARLELRKLATTPAPARAAFREQLVTSILPRWLAHLEARLAANDGGHGFAVGAAPSIADIALWHFLEVVHDNGLDAALAAAPLLATFYQRFGDRSGIAAHRASSRRYPPQPFPTQ
jgi:glutathione S-transferase